MISQWFSKNIKFLRLLILWITPFYCVAENSELTIVFAADMPLIGQQEQGSYASLAAAVKQYRNSQPNSLFLFGGNSLGPSPLSSFDNGSHIIDLLNGIEPDAMGVAKREYLYLEEQLSLRAFEAAFPLVATNIFDPQQYTLQDGLIKSILIRKGPFNIGVIAVVDPKARQQYLLKRVIVQQISESILIESQQLKLEGADLIVVMHGTLLPEIDELLQHGTINLSLVEDPFAPDSALETAKNIPNKVLLSRPGDIAIVNIKGLNDGQYEIDWHTEHLSLFKPDAEIEKQENDYVRRINRLMKLPISLVNSPFNTFRKQIRTSENEFANLITDAMVEHTEADVAIYNSGAIRGDRQYLAGHIFTRKDLIEELPFRANIVTLDMTGSAIFKSIEDSISDYPMLRGKFPQVSNMEIQFDGSRPAGSRIVSFKIKGNPIKPDKLYKVATSDYLFNGGDGYVHVSRARQLPNSISNSTSIQDLALRALLSHNSLDLKKQNRIIDINKQQTKDKSN